MSLSQHTVSLATELGALLVSRGWTISCAESCTGGGIGYAITAIAGSSAWFERGFITYSNQAKAQLLGVDDAVLQLFGAVSSQVAEQMANGAAQAANAELAIAVTGIAGPDGGSAEKPVGTVWFGLHHPDGTISHRIQFDGDRAAVREQTIHHALTLCIERLKN